MPDPTFAEQIETTLKQGRVGASTLVNWWEAREANHWHEDLGLLKRVVQVALAQGEYLLVCDASADALKRAEGDFDFAFLRAQALHQVGSRPEALEIIQRLERAPKLSADRTTKLRDLSAELLWGAALEEEEPEERATAWASALAAYEKLEAVRPKEPMPVIRQAALETLLQHPTEAKQRAKHALELCKKYRAGSLPGPIRRGIEAIAWLILGAEEEARRAIEDAVKSSPGAVADHAQLRHRVRMIVSALGGKASAYDEFFPPLNLVVFGGHKIDPPGRSHPRFPRDAAERIGELIRQKLNDLKALVGVGSGACGADLLFHEAMLERGGSVHLVLPWARDRFLKNSVEPHEHAIGWAPRFERVWEKAASRRVIGEFEPTAEDIGLAYARSVMAGRARLMARAQHLDLIPLALWDGVVGTPGGTGGFIRFWRQQGVRPAIIRLEGAAQTFGDDDSGDGSITISSGKPSLAAPAMTQQVKSMLFADIVGYSRLPEHSIPAFVHVFMGGVSRLAASALFPPLSVNTWGDAIYVVFDTAEGAGEFALDLIDFVNQGDWSRHGLEWFDAETQKMKPLNLRIGLHAGPVFVHFDPVVRHLGFTGAHVSRAARIEPIADAGKVFASEEFAALSAVEQARGFVCEYAGTRKLAKKYPGDFRLYRLRRVTRLPLDDLARAIHANYCRQAVKRGETIDSKPALRLWDDLPDDYKRTNREAAAAIPKLLSLLGYELEPSPPGTIEEFSFADEEVQKLAELEHERFCRSRREAGYRYGKERDEVAKTHPYLLPWAKLPDDKRKPTLDQILEIPLLVSMARQRIRRKS